MKFGWDSEGSWRDGSLQDGNGSQCVEFIPKGVYIYCIINENSLASGMNPIMIPPTQSSAIGIPALNKTPFLQELALLHAVILQIAE